MTSRSDLGYELETQRDVLKQRLQSVESDLANLRDSLRRMRDQERDLSEYRAHLARAVNAMSGLASFYRGEPDDEDEEDDD